MNTCNIIYASLFFKEALGIFLENTDQSFRMINLEAIDGIIAYENQPTRLINGWYEQTVIRLITEYDTNNIPMYVVESRYEVSTDYDDFTW